MASLRIRTARILLVGILALSSFGLMGLSKPPAPPSVGTPPPGPAPAVPEPTGFLVFALGAGAVGIALHRRNRNS